MHARQAVIHGDNLKHNLALIRSLAPGVPICLAVKANAYGHGALAIARLARDAAVEALGVATVDEAMELRQGGIEGRIILYGISSKDEYTTMVAYDIEGFGVSMEQIRGLEVAAEAQGKTVGIHVKVDTGMGRIGCTPADAPQLALHVARSPWLRLQGLCTHFPVAEDQRDFTRQQRDALVAIADKVRAQREDPGVLHAANSAGICKDATSHLGMIRPGLIAYGYPPTPDSPLAGELRPVMELRSSLRFIKKVPAGTSISYGLRWTSPRETWIGTIPLGYADGLPRLCSGKIQVRVGDRLCQQVGTICMDQCMIDLGPEDPPALGTMVTVFGPGKGMPTANDLAQAVGTIPYEILCGISVRVPRTLHP